MLGGSLPAKAIALTFDDGPGVRTLELSAYLRAQGVHAAFFVNGKNCTAAEVLPQLVADGHVVGNHTQHHVSLTGRVTNTPRPSDATIVDELAQTDAIIAPFVENDRFVFRPPYGDFDAMTAATLAASAMAKYVGPVDWDIGDHMGAHQAADWDCWSAGNDGKVLGVEQCGDLYLEEIDAVGHGVVLMHDPYFIGGDPAKGGTVDMVKYIVPKLQAKGYSFVRVDEVPDIAAELPPLPPDPSATEAGTPDPASTNATPSSSAPATQSSAPPVAKSKPAAPDVTTSGTNPDPCPRSPHDQARKASRSGLF